MWMGAGRAHAVDGGLVGGLLLARADEARGRQGGSLGDAHELEGQVAVRRRAPGHGPTLSRRRRAPQPRPLSCTGGSSASGTSSDSTVSPAIAHAAASFISRLIAVAPASQRAAEDARVAEHVVDASARRRRTRRPRASAASGSISGSGLVSARMTWPCRTMLRRDQPGPARGGDDDVGLGHHRRRCRRSRSRARGARAWAPRSGRRRGRGARPRRRMSAAMPKPAAPRPSWPTVALARSHAGVPARGQMAAASVDDGGAVDVVVHDRLRQRLDQPALDLEAVGRARCPRGGCRRSSGRSARRSRTNSSTSLRVDEDRHRVEMPANCW